MRRSASMIVVVCGLMSLLAPPARAALTDRQAQARTLADIRNTGTAMFSWLVDQVSFAPPGAEQIPAASTVDFLDYPAISHGDLEDLLVPQYMQSLPELDGWGHPYDYRLNVANPLSPKVMAIRSPGRDGDFSGDSYPIAPFDPDHFDEDIVWTDGFFARWPEPTEGLSFYTLPPCRLFDTRQGSALQSGTTGSYGLGGDCGIPMSAKALALNVTAIESTGLGHISLFSGSLPPMASTVNFSAGQVRSNNAIVGLGPAYGEILIRAVVAGGGQVHLILDVSGYFE